MRSLTCFLVILLILAAPAVTAHTLPPRQGAVASAHPLASQVGQDILRQGGNAFDAAIAISAALAVVEPYGSGLGGGGFFLLRQAHPAPRTADHSFLDARERAPLAITSKHYQQQGKNQHSLSLDGPLAAGIPGIPAALDHLAQHQGRLPLAASLAPAIRLAKAGFIVDEVYRERARWRLQALRQDPESRRLFLHNGELPPLGYRLRQPELANTLTRLAQKGRDSFYTGELAQQLVSAVRAAGGVWQLEDLAQYQVIERQPLRFTLANGDQLISAPPPSAGGLALAQSLGMLEHLPWQKAQPVQRSHFIIEALRRAYRDRVLLGDPDHVAIPSQLLQADYLRQLSASINAQRATPSSSLPPATPWREGEQTTHFSVLDQEGNAVAATLSLNMMFGAAFTVPGTGILLNDQMDDFSIDPQGQNAYGLTASPANALAPGKRPLSSMSPTFIENAQQLASFGTPGGSRIPSMVLLAILAQQEQAPIHDWVTRPRFHHQYLPDVVEYEAAAFTPAQQGLLKAYGHHLKPMQRAYGNLQVIRWDKSTGQVEAASDPRFIGQSLLVPINNP